MIDIKRAKDCCGCSACVEACPKQCISFEEDKEGFRYPKVDLDRCIHCNLCEKVCPVINLPAKKEIAKVSAAINNDESVRLNSSSGGIFSALAERVLRNGGVVFGAVFDENWEVRHSYIERVEELHRLRGSKYLQSRMESSYKDAQKFLNAGREVLFSGTPCQIAGLRRFLRKDYENLIAVDFICHGVPSPKVWRLYLRQLIKQKKIGDSIQDIKNIYFRAKKHGWTNFDIIIDSQSGRIQNTHEENAYYQAFNMNVILRPICFSCPFKGGHSGSDMTLADFWGISKVDPSMQDEKGTSMIIEYGHTNELLSRELTLKTVETEVVNKCNPSFYHISQYNGNRVLLFGKLDSTDDLEALLIRCTNPTKLQRIFNVLYRKFHSDKL